jgi:hypothetical protein
MVLPPEFDAAEALVYYRNECLRLQTCLLILRDCADPKCMLCGRCLAAANTPIEITEPPQVADDDPIRTWRPPRKPDRSR